uniref:Calmodulin-like n=1 Tax=Ciona intestinalis TaxID=7719 RepID=F6RJW9_CIOIN
MHCYAASRFLHSNIILYNLNVQTNSTKHVPCILIFGASYFNAIFNFQLCAFITRVHNTMQMLHKSIL